MSKVSHPEALCSILRLNVQISARVANGQSWMTGHHDYCSQLFKFRVFNCISFALRWFVPIDCWSVVHTNAEMWSVCVYIKLFCECPLQNHPYKCLWEVYVNVFSSRGGRDRESLAVSSKRRTPRLHVARKISPITQDHSICDWFLCLLQSKVPPMVKKSSTCCLSRAFSG